MIGAAHAGWKGALAGVLEATIAAMETLGARRASTAAVLGPTISQKSYEVGAEFAERFIAASASYASFFAASARDGHFLFDLPGFIAMRLRLAGIGSFEDLARDTYAEPDVFLFLPPLGAQKRTRLRPPDRRDRARCEVTQAAAFSTIGSAAAFGSAGAPSQAVLPGICSPFMTRVSGPRRA